MESTEYLSSRAAGRAVRQFAERVLDVLAQSGVVIAPAALLFALFQLSSGAPDLGLMGLAVAALAGLGIYARLIAPFQLRVKTLEIRGSRLAADTASISDPQSTIQSPLRVCFFSDLHVGRFKRTAWVRRVVALVNAQRPDVVLIGGDFVGHLDHYDLAEMLAPLAQLHAPLGVYAVLGNHDYGLPGPDHSPELARLLRHLNVRLLHNECLTLGGRLQLVGIDELWGHLDAADAAFCACGQHSGSAGANLPRIMLGHNPDLMMKINHRADLFLFGHTHGGQIYIPFLSRLIVPVEGNLYRGTHDLPQGRVYITTGCGETTTPTRLGARPEVVVISVS